MEIEIGDAIIDLMRLGVDNDSQEDFDKFAESMSKLKNLTMQERVSAADMRRNVNEFLESWVYIQRVTNVLYDIRRNFEDAKTRAVREYNEHQAAADELVRNTLISKHALASTISGLSSGGGEGGSGGAPSSATCDQLILDITGMFGDEGGSSVDVNGIADIFARSINEIKRQVHMPWPHNHRA